MSESPTSYSPARRTAVILTGTGTAGAYHAGVLRALHEAGVRVDLIAARGVGALGAMFAAIDGGARLWDADGFWRSKDVARLYGWRPRLVAAGWAFAVAAACLLLPVALLAGIAVMYLGGWVLALAGATAASAAVSAAAGRLLAALFDTAALPTVVPRLAMLAVLVAIAILAVATWSARKRPGRHEVAGWLSLVGAPLDAREAVIGGGVALWELIRGAAPLAPPTQQEISRRYSETLTENLGQPGFRELLIVTHDLDARRDLTFALLSEPHRGHVFGRTRGETSTRSVADRIDLAGAGRDHALDALSGALRLPLATDPHIITFAPEGYWRGESHRLADRPAAAMRVFEEAAAAGAEQAIVVSAAPALEGPHTLAPARGDARGRAGEFLVAGESAALRDAHSAAAALGLFRGGLFLIRPAHNPCGPLDVAGCYDPRSDRQQPVAELIDRGYEDAYRQFIEPVVGGDVLEKTV
jgi:hypothetical protein